MKITLDKVSKRYTKHWILRNIDYQFDSNYAYAITGDNGSGKSTLIKMLSGFLSPSIGEIAFKQSEKVYAVDEVYKLASLWGPYVSLIKNLTLEEMIGYYIRNKAMRNGHTTSSILEELNLRVSKKTLIGSLSSGQAQRVGLALTIMADSSILLLDEPGSYLDREGKEWFQRLLTNYRSDRLMIIASNEQTDLKRADKTLDILAFK